jgi:hypothetical protein
MKRKKCAGVFLSGAEASFIYWRERHDLKFVPPPEPFMRYVAEQHRDQRRGTGVNRPRVQIPTSRKGGEKWGTPRVFFTPTVFHPRVFHPDFLKRPE